MKKVDGAKERKSERPKRAKLTQEEIIRRMEDFPKRRQEFIAAIRINKEQENQCTDSGRSKRAKLSPEESLKRMEEFDKRKEKFIRAIRKNKS